MNRSVQAMVSIIGGILTFFVVVEFIDAMDTSGWGTLSVTIIGTLLPAVLAIGVMLMALKAFGVIGGRGE